MPVALTFGILWGLGRVSASQRSRAIVLSLALAAWVVSFSMLAWVVPAANQAFRVSVAGGPVAKGIRELSLGELRDGVGAGRDDRLFALEYQKRWALGSAPMTLALFTVVLARGRRWGRLAPVAIGCLTLLVYYVTMVSTETAGRHQTISVVTAAWAPNPRYLDLVPRAPSS